MKPTKFFLMLFLITAFGTTEYFAQTVDATAPTTKAKRKYTKKADATSAQIVSANSLDNSANNSPKPKRTYTKKSDASLTSAVSTMQTSTDNSSPKSKRTYTKKTDASVPPAVSTMQTSTDNSSPKSKRTYTKKADATVTPAVSTMQNTIDNSLSKPKRTYTKKSAENSVAPTTNTVQPTAQYSPPVAQRNTTPVQATVKQPYNPSNGGTYNGHQVLVGPRGGKYYINKNGNKTYIK